MVKQYVDADEETLKLVFLNAGIALMHAQTIETQLAGLLWPSRVAKGPNGTIAELDKVERELWTMTIGKLQNLCKNELGNATLHRRIDAIRKTRNKFVHSFFMGRSLKERNKRVTQQDAEKKLKQVITIIDKLVTFLEWIEPRPLRQYR